ncbi:hypothetical protein [uncultured Winogradskyella sp.]|uniref:hypothetical protein n=1 Tax=uncultured Winogradskyella sp. TaxID=395353 RepID=UPI00261EFA42|nr:hypothetical protein [uncultured Winogradskyella sp.]
MITIRLTQNVFKYFVFLVLFFTTLSYAQEDSFDIKIQNLKDDIVKSNGGHKLRLLDSLSRFISYNRTHLKFDSITKNTIDLAYELDSIDLALVRTNSLIFYYANRVNRPKEGIKVLKDFESRNIQTNDYDLLARLYTNAGDAYFFSGAIKESIPIYNKAEDFALKDNDSVLYAQARTYKASAYVDTGDYATGSQLLSETTKMFTVLKDTSGILSARNTLAVVYSKMGFYEEAKEERAEVIRISKMQKKYRSIVPNLFNAAIDADKNDNQALRIKYLNESYRYNKTDESTPRTRLSSIITYSLLSAYSENDSLVKAQQFYNKVQSEFSNEDQSF